MRPPALFASSRCLVRDLLEFECEGTFHIHDFGLWSSAAAAHTWRGWRRAVAGWHSGRFNGVYVCHEVWEKEMHQTWDCGNEVSIICFTGCPQSSLSSSQLASLASTQVNLSGFLIYRFPRRSTQRHGSWTISWLFLCSPRPFAGRTDCSVGRSEHRHRHWEKQRQRRVGLIGKCYMVG